MQKASKKLHEALSKVWSCPAEHAACLSLDIEPSSARVRFELAWTCLAGSGSGRVTNKPLWLTVETISEDTDSALMDDQEPINARAKVLVTSLREFSLGKASAVTSTTPAQPHLNVESELNLSSIKDLCLHLKQRQGALQGEQRNTEPLNPCLDFLQKSNTSKHFLFQSSEYGHGHSSISLEEALMKAKALRYGGISQIDRIHLAKVLSMAVLQYHSTPWLGNEWQSSDVLFFGVKDLNEDPLTAPYLSACPINPVDPAARQSTNSSQSIFATNSLLYCLGVMLIELAFERPLTELQEPGDYHPGESSSITLQRTTSRLANEVHRKINMTYEDSVKRCLRCQFGGDILQLELDNVILQRAFYTQVVCQLQGCYKAVAMFEPS